MNKLIFKTLTLRNFLSYGNVTTIVNLDRPGATLILGEDLDNTADGQGANGCGKFQHVDCKIKTPSGWIRMGDIEVGQQLQMPDGSTASVTGVFPQGKQPLYRVTFVDGRSTLAGGPHLWTVFSHRWGKQETRGVKTATTEDLIKYLQESNDRNNKPWYNIFVPSVVHPDTSDCNLPINPYLLGVLLGDGYIGSSPIKVTSADTPLIKECSNLLSSHEQQLKYIAPNSNSGYDWTICNCEENKHKHNNNSIKENLQKLGLYGCKSNTKFIPLIYIEGTSKQQKLDLLSGLLDTDGTVSKTKGVSFCSVSERLAKDVQYLIRSIGGKSKITSRFPFYTDANGNKIKGQLAYYVSIRYRNPRELFRLERKKELLSQGETQYANEGVRLVSIERVEDGEAQCIMVDHLDHLYITDDFIVTHNTALLNALAYAAYDKPVSSISKDNLVNNQNKKNMEITLEFERNGHNYFIRRVRKSKSGAAGNFVEFLVDGKDVTRGERVNITNQAIVQALGIPYELFIRIVVFSATHIPFLDLPVRHPTAPNQSEFIEELFDLKSLSEKALVLKDDIKIAEQRLELVKTKNNVLEQEHVRHEIQLKSARHRVRTWKATNDKKIAEIKDNLQRMEEVDIEDQRRLYDEFQEKSARYQIALKNQASTEGAIIEYNDMKVKLERELTHLRDQQCPYCLQQYENTEEKISESEQALVHSVGELESREVILQEHDDVVIELKTKLTTIKKLITVADLEELLAIKAKSKQYQKQITEKETTLNPYLEPLEELENAKLEAVDYKIINELSELIEHQKFLYKLLTKKDSFVRKALLNKNIPYLNTRLQTYLTQLGLQHIVEFTHEMTAKIYQFDHEMDFGNLSNGQRARVNIGLSLAFRDVLQSIHGKVNICMLDEVLDVGLDNVGVRAAARLLKRLGRDEKVALFIISHRDEIDGAFESKMKVQMQEGFSFIVED